MRTNYQSSDFNWFKRVAKIETAIQRINLAMLGGHFCDKWGYPLRVGDTTNYGIIIRIENQFAVMNDGVRTHYSYLRKI